jgi:hypothetical protein
MLPKDDPRLAQGLGEDGLKGFIILDLAVDIPHHSSQSHSDKSLCALGTLHLFGVPITAQHHQPLLCNPHIALP